MASVSTSHEEESSISGTRAMSGSPANRRRKCVIASRASIIGASMHTSMIWAPSSTCLRDDLHGLVPFLLPHQAGETGASGYVRALPDIDKVGFRLDDKRFQPGQGPSCGLPPAPDGASIFPPFQTKERCTSGGWCRSSPPTMFTKPSCKYFFHPGGHLSHRLGIPAEPVRKSGVGGWHETGRAAVREGGVRGKDSICFGAQGAVEPDGKQVHPGKRSVKRLDGLSGEQASAGIGKPFRRASPAVNIRHGAAATAALALRLSKTVSTISRSAPPSARVRGLPAVRLEKAVEGDVAHRRVGYVRR